MTTEQDSAIVGNPPAVRKRKRAPDRWKAVGPTVALIAGLLAVIAFVYRKQLTPAIAVETGTVVLLTEDSDASAGGGMTISELLFQASGWIEPDPWPVKVAVLTDGFVEDVFVNEGDVVTNGQMLARLDAADAHLEREGAVAAVTVATARVELALDTWTRIDALPPRDTTPTERVAARAALDAARGELDASRTRLAAAELALDHTVIRANMDGRVLHRFVDPGSKRRAAMDDPNSAVLVSLYSPTSLQVRVDVPLAEARRLDIGQPTRISTAMLPGRVFTGRVTRIVGQADLQRNTLQAKVRVDTPDPRLRPEVLCRVEFWSITTPATEASSHTPAGAGGRLALWVPETALTDPEADDQQVWVIDPLSGTASRRTIRVGRVSRDGRHRVLKGLRANETVVIGGAETLAEGRRVTARVAEDQS